MFRLVDAYTTGATILGQYRLVKTPAALVVSAADTDVCVGVTQSGAAVGAQAEVCIFGETKAIASGAITKGARLAPDAGGKVKVAAPGDLVIGVARSAAGANNDIFDIFFNPSTVVLA